ncbi:hypothetical protein MNV49_000019 [Pseudohyphozyma bogoriensis]|nr:hypothetical protein MNV49_000019 [Pseudohyphozyma bogoriensis]
MQRLSTCPGCRALRLRPASSSRLLHASPALARQPHASTSKSSSPSLASVLDSWSRAPGKALATRRKPPPFTPRPPQRRRAAPSVDDLRRKLVQHLVGDWLKHGGGVRAIGVDLGVDPKRFEQLGVQFANKALRRTRDEKLELDRVVAWDLAHLQLSYADKGAKAVKDLVLRNFFTYIANQPPPTPTVDHPVPDPTLSKLQHLARLADNRFPGEEFPKARQIRRKLILHVGPTNSGKTHSALVALARARTGVYAGPLRLLAHEVFSRFNEGKIGDEGKRVCNLITGEEKRILDPNLALSSCTVEMFPLHRRVDVGVIDEIQMIGDPQRGTAWTAAVIGAECDELHLCGEESVVELIESLAAELGDELIVKRYQRLSPLVISDESLNSDLSKIKPGDCFVTFSRSNIFAYKRMIEEQTGLRVAVAYGGLPPEVREEQARAFNAGEYDVLVASDAVGMGLNLKIRRIVFETLHKWDGKAEVTLPIPQIKQIGGRAGRFGIHAVDDAENTNATTLGGVTALEEKDMKLLRTAMQAPIVQVKKAALLSPRDATRNAHAMFPESTPFSRFLEIMTSIARTSPLYSIPFQSNSYPIFDAIEGIEPLSTSERVVFGSAPVNTRDPKVVDTVVEFTRKYAMGQQILMEQYSVESGLRPRLKAINDAREQMSKMETPSLASLDRFTTSYFTPQNLAQLESFHRCLTLYLWLSYRLDATFSDQEAARLLRKEVEGAIDFSLAVIRFEKREQGIRRIIT